MGVLVMKLRDAYRKQKRREDIHLSLNPDKRKPHGKCGGTAKCGCPCPLCLAGR